MKVDIWPADFDAQMELFDSIPSWSYSGFHEFRTFIAAEAGITLGNMEGFTKESDALSWDKVADPIRFFLNHSDCDGELSPQECEAVAPRLRRLLENATGYDKRTGQKLVDLMDRCAERDVKLQFR